MSENNEKVNQLFSKLELLLKKQDSLNIEVNQLRAEIIRLKDKPTQQTVAANIELNKQLDFPVLTAEKKADVFTIAPENKPVFKHAVNPGQPKSKSDLEKFIGENLISKIGILITVIGVGIGAKYSIEHQLISPLTRIILGYIAGIILLLFGIKLKKSFEKYSAVLVSGAIAILYFITYAANSFYGLFPQAVAFLLMVVFTAFSVVAAINYNQQIIAHIGLVGAYAVPFLLSNGTGRVEILFSYMAIINTGILIIAFKKYWKPLYYSAFYLTWLIFIVWIATGYYPSKNFNLALIFEAIFFTIFYLIFLGYKLLQKEKFLASDIIMLLSNSFIFYGLGYYTFIQHTIAKYYLGMFTLVNAIVHFMVSMVIYRHKLADRNIFFLIMGMVLVFITITIPVQLNGNWVTLLWVSEATLLFWIGRTKKVDVYEKLSYPIMLLAFISLTQDWHEKYNHYDPYLTHTKLTPLLNINFLSSLLFAAAFSFIYIIGKKRESSSTSLQKLSLLFNFCIPAVLLTTVYFAFRLEISNYWHQLYLDSIIEIKNKNQELLQSFYNYDLLKYRIIWILNYTLLFISILGILNIKKIKNLKLGIAIIALGVLATGAFLIDGLYSFSELRDSFLNQTLSAFYFRSKFNLGIRYISFALAGFVLYTICCTIKQNFMKPATGKMKTPFDALLHISILWVLSSELINWADIFNSSQSYKLGLSILWGIYALLVVGIGIWKNKKHLRIGAIALFGVTLIKLFFYDISHLNTIAKTIVFVSLGILLLIISFLYNKYKHLISDEADK